MAGMAPALAAYSAFVDDAGHALTFGTFDSVTTGVDYGTMNALFAH